MPIPRGAKVRTKGRGKNRRLLFIRGGKVIGSEKPRSSRKKKHKKR